MRQGGFTLAAGRVRSKRNKNREKNVLKKIRRTQNGPRNPHQPSDRDHFKPARVPRVSPYLPATIDTGFVEVGLVLLSQSVKTTNATHALTDTQAD